MSGTRTSDQLLSSLKDYAFSSSSTEKGFRIKASCLLQDLVDETIKSCLGSQQAEEVTHTGIHHARTEQEHNLLERLFAQAWEDRNDSCLNCPDIHGTLDYILSQDNSNPDITPQRDATVAATVIQWLGTNVGMDFMMDVLVQAYAQHPNNIGHRFFESFLSCLKEASPDSYEILRSRLLALLS